MLRILWTGFLLNGKQMTQSSFFQLTAIGQPLIFATIAFYMFQSGGRHGTLLYAALGAGMMGVWSTTLFGSGCGNVSDAVAIASATGVVRLDS